jgi:hypothetical protein
MIIDRSEKFETELSEALRNIKIADHMVNITYNFVKDPKLLSTIMENIFLAVGKTMSSVLLFERIYKRIPPFNDNFDSKLYFYEKKVVQRYDLDKEYLKLIKEIRELMLSHKESEMEFSRKNQYIICNKEYNMKKIDIDKIKRLVRTTKSFISDVDKIIHRKKEYEKAR